MIYKKSADVNIDKKYGSRYLIENLHLLHLKFGRRVILLNFQNDDIEVRTTVY